MQKLTPCLWFNGRVEEALEFYTSIFKNSKVNDISRYGKNMPMPAGSILTATFDIEGQAFMMLNGGPQFKHSEAISFVINCKDQEEIDYYWDNLTANGGSESVCGWLVDPYGISWQVVPEEFDQLIKNSGSNADKVMQALMQMIKLDINKLRAAATGE
ncbi:VOC family protein [Flavobacterium sp. DG1-102-2]|uniref:VOC family protein n=1 Tax=Flavobacterium sp. DG1-102-2 TaxID=3081663 RepID=UPI002948CDC5|nr:VOC family protein [Flavobacterium sp. DG1-102-2]MDV6169868.1 VOC family protein [Flavobacterium sp. DG1-102-2]